MTDLDTLRKALKAPGDAEDPVDISAIISRGRRLRRRRILTAVAGGACAAAAVFGAVTGIVHLTRPSPAPGLGPAGSTRSVPATSRSGAPARSPNPYATPSPSLSYRATPLRVSPTTVPSATISPTPAQPAGSPSPGSSGQPTVGPTSSAQPGTSAAWPASRTPGPTPTR